MELSLVMLLLWFYALITGLEAFASVFILKNKQNKVALLEFLSTCKPSSCQILFYVFTEALTLLVGTQSAFDISLNGNQKAILKMSGRRDW